MKNLLAFVFAFIRYALSGSRSYYLWLGFLSLFILPWLWGSHQQLTIGMGVTGLSDQVSWGIYIANFVFLVGVAAGAVTVVFPAYVYNYEPLKKVAVLGEILAVSAVIICILFIFFHMGRIDRLWHMLPGIGIYNFPGSILTWDVLVLTGYFILNAIAAAYYLYKKYHGLPLHKGFYATLVFVCIVWAFSIHTVTAFLLNTLPARPMWHNSMLPIRFIATAFAAGPALLILIFLVIRSRTQLWIEDRAINLLSTIIVFCLTISLFLTLSEIVTELYHPTEHSAGLRYLMFGHHGLNNLVPWFWSSLILMLLGWIGLMVPKWRKDMRKLPVLMILVFAGIWVEKGMALIIPGSIPTPIGEYAEYSPTLVEIANSLGNWAIGFIIMTLLMKGAVGILTGELKAQKSAEAGYA